MISEEKMKIVINNYFQIECDINTSIRQAFEKGFRIGVQKCQSAQPEQSEMIKDIRKWINSGNRGNADYFIVDKIEEIINKYERRYNQQTGGD